MYLGFLLRARVGLMAFKALFVRTYRLKES